MREKQFLLPIFTAALFLALLLFLFGHFGFFSFLSNVSQNAFFSLSQLSRGTTVPTEDQLKKENRQLQEQLSTFNQVVSDNKALRDQFATVVPSSRTLTPAKIVGMPGVVPNVTFPNTFIVNVGKKSGATVGNPAVVQNSLIGVVTAVSDNYSEVTLTTSKASSFSVKDSTTGAIGVAKGQGNGELLLGNVQLSDTIKAGDMIVALGSQNLQGKGVDPDLILGKIVSIEKNPSALFQTARVVPLVQFDRLSIIFIAF